jgi:phosphoribosylformylglycinamidine synthase
MGQLVGCIEGMAEACRALDFPIVSGNVSLYNETKNEDGTGSAILPTPAIGGVGLLEDWRKSATIAFKAEGDHLWLIGGDKWEQHLGQSLWLREILGREEGPPPPVDLEMERRTGEFVRSLILDQAATAVHDVSDGGLLVAVAEMALAGGIGANVDPEIDLAVDLPLTGQMFGEDQGRYVVAVSPTDSDALVRRAGEAGIKVSRLGSTGGQEIWVGEGPDALGNFADPISLAEIRRVHEGFFPALMGGDLTVA